jgi:hypothetical protein
LGIRGLNLDFVNKAAKLGGHSSGWLVSLETQHGAGDASQE